MKVKICGVTNQADAFLCEEAGADAIGFVHFPGRSRSVPLEMIADMCSHLGPMTTKVLVCAPKDEEETLRMCDKAATDVVQLYSLDPSQVQSVRDSGIGVIRAVKPTRAQALRFREVADALLFEQWPGGTGRQYDYSAIPLKTCPRAIIAGGLNLDNVRQVRSLGPYGLDVSSGVERSVGRKDPWLVHEFVRRCKA